MMTINAPTNEEWGTMKIWVDKPQPQWTMTMTVHMFGIGPHPLPTLAISNLKYIVKLLVDSTTQLVETSLIYNWFKSVGLPQLDRFAVLITPPPIPTGLRESSRIPTGLLLDFNKFSKKAFSHIFSFPFLLDSHGTPSGLQLNLHKVNAVDS